MAFGFALPKLPTQALAGDPAGGSGLNAADKLMMFGAILKGHPDLAMQVPLMAQARRAFAAQQSATNDLATAVSGQTAPIPSRAALVKAADPANADTVAPDGSYAGAGDGGVTAAGVTIPTLNIPRSPAADAVGQPPSVRGALPMLARLARSGGNPEPWTKMLEAAQPKALTVNGRVLDEHDPGVYGQFYGEAPTKGAEPVYDRGGKQVGWHMADGAIQAIGSAANAEARGQQSAQAEFAGPIERAKQSAQADFAGPIAAGTAAGKAAVENPNTLETHDLNGVPTTMTRQQWLTLSGGGTPRAPAGGAGAAEPRGIRNNNPLNLTLLASGRWDGQNGYDGKYATFATPEAGWTAADKNLQAYGAHHGINTLEGVITRWAPQSDNNDTGSYIATVAKDLGIDPKAPLPLDNQQVRHAVLQAMAKVEQGRGAVLPAAPGAAVTAGQPAGAGFHGQNPSDKKVTEEALADAKQAEYVASLGHQFQGLNKDQSTGPGYRPMHVPIPFLDKVDLNPVGALARQYQSGVPAMENLSMQLATNLRAPGQRLTQAEIMKNLESVPNLRHLPAQNDTAVAGYDERAATKRAYANFVSNWLASNGTLNGADAAWARQQGAQTPGAPKTPSARAAPPMKGQPMQQIRLKSGGVATVVPVG